MKKITLLFVFIGMITLQSCTVNEVRDEYDTIQLVKFLNTQMLI